MLEYEAIADRVARESDGPVLNWGCGAGQMTELLRSRGASVESFDYREGEPPRKVPLELASGASAHVSGHPVELPFPDEHFASVIALGVLEHVQYPDRSLNELRRVLRPGGRLFIYELPNRYSYQEAIARRLGRRHHGESPFDQTYNRRRAAELVAFSGFRIDRLSRVNMLPLSHGGALSSRCARAILLMSRALARVPLLNRLCSSFEIDATAR